MFISGFRKQTCRIRTQTSRLYFSQRCRGNDGNDGNANLKRRSQVCYESQAPVRQKKFTESAFTMGRATGIQGTTAPPSR